MILDAGLVASRFLHFVASLGLFGVSLYPLYTFREGLDRPADFHAAFTRRLRRTLVALALATLLSGALWFAFTAAAMADNLAAALDPSIWLTVVTGSDFGPLWTARAAVAVTVLLLLIAWPRRHSAWLVPLLAAVICGSLAATGHGREPEGPTGAIHIAGDAAHLFAAGAWLGGLWPLSIAFAMTADPKLEGPAHSELLLRFSSAGMLAVAVLAASGIINGCFLVGSPQALVSTLYGQLLLVKIILFLAMVTAAAANRFWITPKFDGRDTTAAMIWHKRIRRHVLAEQILGLSVVAIVSVIGIMQAPI